MKTLIVANWKANPKTLSEARELFVATKDARAIICPPFVYISILKAKGAQDCGAGVNTGEISAVMLKDLGVEYVILGHSERRRYLEETEEMINKKIKAALKSGLKPILCVENAKQARDWQNIIIAFEPVSAIGTGKALSWQKAKKFRQSLARFKTVLYGGSVNSKNAKDYIQKAGFQGLLVGGASLNAKEFAKILELV
ncbi:MAG: triose-phosphate isomerase [bacterium]|nr:triose-phosphate isomerase [bacterium]